MALSISSILHERYIFNNMPIAKKQVTGGNNRIKTLSTKPFTSTWNKNRSYSMSGHYGHYGLGSQ